MDAFEEQVSAAASEAATRAGAMESEVGVVRGTGEAGGGDGRGALEHWRAFDLDGRRGALDAAALGIGEAQERSLKARKRLAESTKAFKGGAAAGLGAEERLKAVGPLMKGYQEEIDALTKRAKAAEGAFVAVYKGLWEGPDPVGALEAGAEAARKVAELGESNARLRAELEEYREESARIVNREATVRRLEERVKSLEAEVEEARGDAGRAEEALRRVEGDGAGQGAEAAARERKLVEELDEAARVVRAMHASRVEAEGRVMASEAEGEEKAQAMEREMGLLAAELDRAMLRLQELELERKAAGRGARVREGAVGGEEVAARALRERVADLEAELRRAEASAAKRGEENAELRERLEGVEAAVNRERLEHSRKAREADAELESARRKAGELAGELAARPSAAALDSLRAQVRALQAVQYNAFEGDDDDGTGGAPAGEAGVEGWGDDDDGAPGTPGGGKGSGAGEEAKEVSIRSLLMDKNRRLEDQLTLAKGEAVDKGRRAAELAERVAQLEEEVADARGLAGRLEEDLGRLRVGHSGRDEDGAPGAAGGPATTLPPIPGGTLLDPKDTDVAAAGAAGGDGGDAGLIAIVAGQRDRFRKKMLELEDAMEKGRVERQKLTLEADKLRADNVSLYEKLRYVQSFEAAGGGGGGDFKRRPGGGVGAGGRDVEQGGDPEYRRLWEETRGNPFAEWAARERDARVRGMRVHDRLMLHGGRLVMGSSVARAAVAAYLGLLHLLVLVALYRMSHASGVLAEGLDVLCAQQAAALASADVQDAQEALLPVR